MTNICYGRSSLGILIHICPLILMFMKENKNVIPVKLPIFRNWGSELRTRYIPFSFFKKYALDPKRISKYLY